jgi:hypothetical protein
MSHRTPRRPTVLMSELAAVATELNRIETELHRVRRRLADAYNWHDRVDEDVSTWRGRWDGTAR